MKPKLYILAGANGSGKSTISNELLPTKGIFRINGTIVWQLPDGTVTMKDPDA